MDNNSDFDDFLVNDILETERAAGERDQRLLSLIRALKGKDFYDDLMLLLEDSESVAGFSIVNIPVGDYQEEDDYDHIKGCWVDQQVNGGYTGDEYSGDCCVEIETGRYFKFHYSM